MAESLSETPPPPPTVSVRDRITFAHNEVVESHVYRLSELMFGSLLAAYVLGFIGFSASNPAAFHTLPQFLATVILPKAPYLFVSMAYAYATASFYLSYHAEILTMPTMPLARLRYDFGLALFQAVAFGCSMLFPKAFPSFLAVTYAVAALRKQIEYSEFTTDLYTKSIRQISSDSSTNEVSDRANPEARADFDKEVKRLLEEKYHALSGWRPVNKGHLTYALLLAIVSALMWPWPLIPSKYVTLALATETLCVSAYICHRGHLTLRNRAAFLYDRESSASNKMNAEYDQLRNSMALYAKAEYAKNRS